MNTPAKVATGLAAISPLPIAVLFIAGFILIVQQNPEDLFKFVTEHELLVSLFNLGFTAYFGLIHVFFIVHSARNPNMGAMRVTWIVCIIIFGAFAFPFYWYHYIWNDGRQTTSSGPLGLN
jgi:hypothetical protein